LLTISKYTSHQLSWTLPSATLWRNSIEVWCTANCMKLNISKTKVTSFSRKTNVLIYDYKLCQPSIPGPTQLRTWKHLLILNFIFIAMKNIFFSHQGMHPIMLTYTKCLFIRHNTTTLKILFTSTLYNEFIDFNGILLQVSAYEKPSSGRYTLITYSACKLTLTESDTETRKIEEPIK
jgi:hypothetical protein